MKEIVSGISCILWFAKANFKIVTSTLQKLLHRAELHFLF